jgi:hypothetical protein
MNVTSLNRSLKASDKSSLLFERRQQTDRRRCYRPKDGLLPSFCRSRQPDRRIGNLGVEWISIEDIVITPILPMR